MDIFDDLEPQNMRVEQERVPEEFRIQCAAINHLTGRVKAGKDWVRGTPAFRGLFVTHCYQGRDAKEGFFLKMLGVVPGVADLLLIWKGGFGFIEMKTKTGHLSPAQLKFKGFCISAGVRYAVCRTVKEVHDTVISWGLVPAHNAIREADLRSDTQKKLDAFNEFKPAGE